MSGKVNIVFGFLYLAITAFLGPFYLVPAKGVDYQKFVEMNKAVQTVKEDVSSDTDRSKVSAALDGITAYLGSAKKTGSVGSAAHAHGNLEALLNIVAGLVILSLALPSSYKTVLSVLFIVGAVFHSGMLYLAMVFGVSAAGKLSIIGAIAILTGLVLAGVASATGIKKGERGE